MNTDTETLPVIYTYASHGMMREKTCSSREEAIAEAVTAFKFGREWPTEIREGNVVVWQTRRNTSGIRDSLQALAVTYAVEWCY